jgi:hypothetical protein
MNVNDGWEVQAPIRRKEYIQMEIPYDING